MKCRAVWWSMSVLLPYLVSAQVLRVTLKKYMEPFNPKMRMRDQKPSVAQGRSFNEPEWGAKLPLLEGLGWTSTTRKNQVDILLKNSKDVYYYGPLSVGTPPQQFHVIYDSGSNDLWVPSSQCGGLNLACWQSNKYESQVSTTYSEVGTEFGLVYGTGYCTGFTSQDTVTIGGVRVENVTFGEAVQESPGYVFLNRLFDGILGLGTPQAPSYLGNVSFLQTMVDQGVLDSNIYCVYLNRNKSAERNAEVTFGGCLDSLHKGNFSFAPITFPSRWMVNISSIAISYEDDSEDEHKFTMPPTPALVDSGTTLIILPQHLFIQLTSFLTGLSFLSEGLVNCSTISLLPNITFSIANQTYPLEGADYVSEVINSSGETVCALAFDSWRTNWAILGDVFMRRYYTMFDGDNMRIGFAPVA